MGWAEVHARELNFIYCARAARTKPTAGHWVPCRSAGCLAQARPANEPARSAGSSSAHLAPTGLPRGSRSSACELERAASLPAQGSAARSVPDCAAASKTCRHPPPVSRQCPAQPARNQASDRCTQVPGVPLPPPCPRVPGSGVLTHNRQVCGRATVPGHRPGAIWSPP
jgi:hypothetical protein